ncbi:MAG: tripartite tricarboxylate transporter substrate binding protein [Phreatobacter sp.]|uniref:Bug family tripartite tricarboxylate transporter substrate binding protein n=1 Tax=Phreatobacter sp. TaxID=1966341 RepID=UPI0027322F44|nr:tripartite tricarboxylate transporter substrate binding protein [Phreatobacter sp.]MDP2802387.1 tripartite tricarboxylate transporter substrate binding protein [Phreatobacter sp.]
MSISIKTSRRSAIFALGALAAAPALIRSASAQAWAPSRPVKLVVAYPAGGPTDGIARIVAQDLSTTLGQQVVVENVGGASGSIGTRQVAKADPDGHTITFGNNQTHGNNMFLLKEPGYDAVKDFAPLAGAGAFEHIFVVKNDLPVKTIPELVALAKSKPGELNYGSTGVGSGSHLSTELFMVRTGIKMTHVPYRGAAPLVQDIVGNRIDVANSTMASVFTQIQAGTLRGIAIGSPKRNAQLPNVATLREQGVINADAESWTGFFAPAATPQPALERLSREILAALAKPTVVEAITKLGFTITARDPAAFRPYHAQEMQTWAEIIRAANIQPAG